MKKVVLSDNDELFSRYKFKHIGEVLEGIPLEFRNFVNTNTTARVINYGIGIGSTRLNVKPRSY